LMLQNATASSLDEHVMRERERVGYNRGGGKVPVEDTGML
jgi:hypothetical protein